MHARQTTVRGDPEHVDDAISSVKDQVLPVLETIDGFKGFSLLVDREAGMAVGISYWETPAALEASEAAVRGPREDTARRAGAPEPEVRVFEVAVDTQA